MTHSNPSLCFPSNHCLLRQLVIRPSSDLKSLTTSTPATSSCQPNTTSITLIKGCYWFIVLTKEYQFWSCGIVERVHWCWLWTYSLHQVCHLTVLCFWKLCYCWMAVQHMLTKLRNRLGTKTLMDLSELKIHVQDEHVRQRRQKNCWSNIFLSTRTMKVCCFRSSHKFQPILSEMSVTSLQLLKLINSLIQLKLLQVLRWLHKSFAPSLNTSLRWMTSTKLMMTLTLGLAGFCRHFRRLQFRTCLTSQRSTGLICFTMLLVEPWMRSWKCTSCWIWKIGSLIADVWC